MVTCRCEIAVMAEAGMARAVIARLAVAEVLAETFMRKYCCRLVIYLKRKNKRGRLDVEKWNRVTEGVVIDN